ncbi:uncharacterized protein BDW43DRAFT_300948 [Aspergillus alliaceus]|uniref:uncharacterized protein n=1 Tax=Petromyces alliaceus TaxID=209559 RepID=UPI0012A68A27|nr:uncharacterized protein BDW43DRAFT_300948 [Aspergillus alliaceus]KAB8232617.1 hypothetical protein BDW43DRAFT_300948 [Aspergillus alliaceus]
MRQQYYTYTFGRLKAYLVVIAVSPNSTYGIYSAASVARDVLHSFQNLKIGLLISIDRGDVVVSTPGNKAGGCLLTAVNGLRAKYDSKGHRLEESITSVLKKHERLQEEAGTDDNPMIHYGLIASGNQLMKDASIHDKFAVEKANHFSCLVIRGIGDYLDAHENNQWQGYAAMVAALMQKTFYVIYRGGG